jgi:uncharacterized RDD family membrane protein YckC
MTPENHSFSSQNQSQPLQVNLDEFNISEESFRPMTKGLGFHQEQKRASFKSSPKELKPFGSARTQPKAAAILSPLSGQTANVASGHIPSGLEAFYGTKGTSGVQVNNLEKKIDSIEEKKGTRQVTRAASGIAQFSAWMIDVLVVASFVAVTEALLVVASGIRYEMFARLISNQDLLTFTLAIFSIYYLLYFTILDLSASPGKTIMGLRLLKTDQASLTVRNTFIRARVSLLSSVALFLPMLLDFQGRLSDTKVVK